MRTTSSPTTSCVHAAGRLCEVAEHGDRPARRAPGDHPELHRREVLCLVDDDVPVGAGVPVEEVARFVEERQVGGGPRRVRTAHDQRLLRRRRARPSAARASRAGSRRAAPVRASTRDTGGHTASSATLEHRVGPDRVAHALGIRREHPVTSVHEAHQPGAQRGAPDVVRHADVRPARRRARRPRRARSPYACAPTRTDGSVRAGLGAASSAVAITTAMRGSPFTRWVASGLVAASPGTLGHEVGDRDLHHRLLAERRQHLRDVARGRRGSGRAPSPRRARARDGCRGGMRHGADRSRSCPVPGPALHGEHARRAAPGSPRPAPPGWWRRCRASGRCAPVPARRGARRRRGGGPRRGRRRRRRTRRRHTTDAVDGPRPSDDGDAPAPSDRPGGRGRRARPPASATRRPPGRRRRPRRGDDRCTNDRRPRHRGLPASSIRPNTSGRGESPSDRDAPAHRDLVGEVVEPAGGLHALEGPAPRACIAASDACAWSSDGLLPCQLVAPSYRPASSRLSARCDAGCWRMMRHAVSMRERPRSR